MKILYIPAKQKNLDVVLKRSELSKLPKKIFLAYTIQYKDLANNIKKQLAAAKITISKTQQVLGCSKVNTKLPILLIGTGRFHALNLFLQSGKIFVLEGEKIVQIPPYEIDRLRNKRKIALMKFLKADSVGILVTTKSGQENLNLAIKLKQRLEKKGKQAFIFISNNIDITQFENFDIDSWVNTACPGLANDSADIIDYTELPKI